MRLIIIDVCIFVHCCPFVSKIDLFLQKQSYFFNKDRLIESSSAERDDLKAVAAKKDNFKYSFAGVAPKIYNLLSTTTRKAQNVSVFKVNFDKDITKYEQVIKNIFGG